MDFHPLQSGRPPRRTRGGFGLVGCLQQGKKGGEGGPVGPGVSWGWYFPTRGDRHGMRPLRVDLQDSAPLTYLLRRREQRETPRPFPTSWVIRSPTHRRWEWRAERSVGSRADSGLRRIPPLTLPGRPPLQDVLLYPTLPLTTTVLSPDSYPLSEVSFPGSFPLTPRSRR